MNQYNPLEAYPWLEPTYRLLVERYHAGKAHHAYLMTHKGDIGQQLLAQTFVDFLLCEHNHEPGRYFACNQCDSCIARSRGDNLNLYLLQPGLAKNGKSEKQVIEVDQVRDVIERIKYDPIQSPKNVVYIPDASKFNVQSSNAILKSLEEPAEHTMFVILLGAGFTVLPTIRSRCVNLKLPSPTLEQMHHFFNTHQIWQPQRDALLVIAGYQPDLILQMVAKDYYIRYQQFMEQVYYAIDSLEIAGLVGQFDIKDSQVFLWQLESLVQVIEMAMKQIVLGADYHNPNLVALPPISKSVVSYLAQDEIDVDEMFDLMNKLQVSYYQIQTFPSIGNNERSLETIAYKMASQFVLYLFEIHKATASKDLQELELDFKLLR